MSEKNNAKVSILFLLIFLVALFISFIPIYFYCMHFFGEISSSHEKWGQFGDFFGGVLNPLFSFLSLLAILITLQFQSKELEISSKELEKSTNALESQDKSIRIQNFDNTYFNLMRLHNEIVESLTTRITSDPKSKEIGRQCFKGVVRSIKNKYKSNPDFKNTEEIIEYAINSFKDVLDQYNFNADHYFRNIYRIVKFVHNSKECIDKKFYIGTLRAQLSPHELAIIFFNGLTAEGEKFKPLIEKYELFDNINISLIPQKNLMPLYNKSAYGECDISKYYDS